jgi:hypothetical protein
VTLYFPCLDQGRKSGFPINKIGNWSGKSVIWGTRELQEEHAIPVFIQRF